MLVVQFWLPYSTLAQLPDQVAHAGDRRGFAPDRPGVGNLKRGGAAGAGAYTAGRGGARHHHQQIGAEALDLLADRVVCSLADRHHRNQCRDVDEDAKHVHLPPERALNSLNCSTHEAQEGHSGTNEGAGTKEARPERQALVDGRGVLKEEKEFAPYSAVQVPGAMAWPIVWISGSERSDLV